MNSRIHIRYEGRVQGVGFRFTCVELAGGFDVTGMVKNEFDGSVSMIAEGEEDQLMGFISAIRSSRLGRYISNEQVGRAAADGSFTGFTVRY
jgi:acylphosphatase